MAARSISSQQMVLHYGRMIFQQKEENGKIQSLLCIRHMERAKTLGLADPFPVAMRKKKKKVITESIPNP